jgi:hypothetical protein
MARSIVLLLIAAAAGAILALAAVPLLGRLGLSWFQAQTSTSSHTIIEQIRMVAKLQTVEYHGTNTVRLDKQDWKGKSSVVYLLDGAVLATVDLQQMSVEVRGFGERREVLIKLPAVKVEDPVVRRFEIVMSCQSFLTAPELSDADRNQLHAQALQGLKIGAQQSGIRDRAAQQAQDYLRTFLIALGYRAIFV